MQLSWMGNGYAIFSAVNWPSQGKVADFIRNVFIHRADINDCRVTCQCHSRYLSSTLSPAVIQFPVSGALVNAVVKILKSCKLLSELGVIRDVMNRAASVKLMF